HPSINQYFLFIPVVYQVRFSTTGIKRMTASNDQHSVLPVLTFHHPSYPPLPMDLTTAYRYNASMMEYYSCKCIRVIVFCLFLLFIYSLCLFLLIVSILYQNIKYF